jgi:hypothetical protein
MAKEKKKPRQRPTDDTLRTLSEHVSYEFDMLLGTAGVLVSRKPTDDFMQNVLVESFLIHVRQVYDFLYRVPKLPTDLIAADYAPTWHGECPTASQELKDLARDVGGRAAHLTMNRVVGQQYAVLTVGRELATTIQRFLAVASPTLFAVKPKTQLPPPWAAPAPGFVFGGPPVTTTSSTAVGSIFISADGDLKKTP